VWITTETIFILAGWLRCFQVARVGEAHEENCVVKQLKLKGKGKVPVLFLAEHHAIKA
jgi:hypothetical protein